MAEQKSKEQVRAEMDAAAATAGADLVELMVGGKATAQDVVVWFAANYLKAGHKRLGRILVRRAKGG